MTSSKIKFIIRILLGISMVGAGIAHFTHAEFFAKLVPASVSEYRDIINAVTGVYQIAIGVCFFVPRLIVVARWGMLLLLAGGLPPAIDQVIHPATIESLGLSRSLAAVRVVVQIVQVWLVWWATSADKKAGLAEKS